MHVRWGTRPSTRATGSHGDSNAQRLQTVTSKHSLRQQSHGVAANPEAFWGLRPRFESWWDYFSRSSNRRALTAFSPHQRTSGNAVCRRDPRLASPPTGLGDTRVPPPGARSSGHPDHRVTCWRRFEQPRRQSTDDGGGDGSPPRNPVRSGPHGGRVTDPLSQSKSGCPYAKLRRPTSRRPSSGGRGPLDWVVSRPVHRPPTSRRLSRCWSRPVLPANVRPAQPVTRRTAGHSGIPRATLLTPNYQLCLCLYTAIRMADEIQIQSVVPGTG